MRAVVCKRFTKTYYRRMKIYTKTGDLGETGLFAGPRVRKDDPRIEAYGTVDEMNAILGLTRCQKLPTDIDALVAGIQHTLFDLGAELATPDPASRGTDLISHGADRGMEAAIDKYEAGLPPLKTFILPGGVAGAAWLHLARTVCRPARSGTSSRWGTRRSRSYRRMCWCLLTGWAICCSCWRESL